MSYDNKIYRVADPVPPPVARPPIYSGGSVGGSAPGAVWAWPPQDVGMGSRTTNTPSPRPPSTGGGKGSDTGCPASRPRRVCFDYYIDPMRPSLGTQRTCECVTGTTGP